MQLFSNTNFLLLLSGQTISSIGDYVFNMTMILWIVGFIAKGTTWGPIAVSGVMVASAIPNLLIGPIAGVYTDRWDKRRTMLLMDVFRTVLIALLLLATGNIPQIGQLVAIYLVIFMESTCAQFFAPARFTFSRDVIAQEDQAQATGMMQVIGNLALILGSALGAALFAMVGVKGSIIIDAASFACSFILIWAIRAPLHNSPVSPKQKSNFREEFREGLYFYKGNKILIMILVTGVLYMMGNGALNSLYVFFITQNLHLEETNYGLLLSVLSLGAIVGAILSGLFAERIGIPRVMWVSIILFGVFVVILSRMTFFPFVLGIVFMMGLSNACMNVALIPILLHVTPRELVGRVISILTPCVTLATLLSSALGGYLASSLNFRAEFWGISLGPIDTIYFMVGLFDIASGIYAKLSLQGFSLERKVESEPHLPGEALKFAPPA